MKRGGLPRKRKKACKKAIGSDNWMGVIIVNEILSEADNKNAKKIPIYRKGHREDMYRPKYFW